MDNQISKLRRGRDTYQISEIQEMVRGKKFRESIKRTSDNTEEAKVKSSKPLLGGLIHSIQKKATTPSKIARSDSIKSLKPSNSIDSSDSTNPPTVTPCTSTIVCEEVVDYTTDQTLISSSTASQHINSSQLPLQSTSRTIKTTLEEIKDGNNYTTPKSSAETRHPDNKKSSLKDNISDRIVVENQQTGTLTTHPDACRSTDKEVRHRKKGDKQKTEYHSPQLQDQRSDFV
ncbi:unnamed protein product [Heterobilharzia americana]|nr:unnamed protein product [Heterobilharzia americana]